MFLLNTPIKSVLTVFAVFGFGLGVAHAAEALAPWPTDPAANMPAAWKPQYHPDIAAHTQFKFIRQGDKTLLQADADSAYGTLVHAFSKPVELKVLGWEWQVLTHPAKANLQTKAGDDAGAKLCAFVQIDESRLGLGTRLALAAARTVSGERLPAERALAERLMQALLAGQAALLLQLSQVQQIAGQALAVFVGLHEGALHVHGLHVAQRLHVFPGGLGEHLAAGRGHVLAALVGLVQRQAHQQSHHQHQAEPGEEGDLAADRQKIEAHGKSFFCPGATDAPLPLAAVRNR